MAFAFGFGGDDIEIESEHDGIAQQVKQSTVDESPKIPPKVHTLSELLTSLPSQISYERLRIEGFDGHGMLPFGQTQERTDIYILRRPIFDIKTQLMIEANPEDNDHENLLSGLATGDLTKGIYEGGFKTWECALDLAAFVDGINLGPSVHVIELGAGSAIPSLVLLYNALRQSRSTARRRMKFTLCDYNEDVLRLATAPNIFIAGGMLRTGNDENDFDKTELDLDGIDQAVIDSTVNALTSQNLAFEFVSGAWGDDLLSYIKPASGDAAEKTPFTLILASETIYSPESTKSFASTLMQLLRRAPSTSTALIAAKKIYFGVGGGIDDFIAQVEKQQGRVMTVADITDAGVGRVLLKVNVSEDKS